MRNISVVNELWLDDQTSGMTANREGPRGSWVMMGWIKERNAGHYGASKWLVNYDWLKAEGGKPTGNISVFNALSKKY